MQRRKGEKNFFAFKGEGKKLIGLACGKKFGFSTPTAAK
jgi:hypothetical protein